MGQGRSRRHLMPVLGLALVGAGLVAGNPPLKVRAAPAPALGFSHEVVADQQRPGFEPDIKVAPDSTIYGSMPFGFSTTESYIWSSGDHGNSYQLTPGNVPPAGKPTTCPGGGDTDLLVDPGGELYFSDLQGLTNLSQSASADKGATWTTNCLGAPNTPVDRMWLAATGSLAGSNLNLYQDYDAVGGSLDPSNPGGNELVETISTDGTTFLPVYNANPGVSCLGSGVLNCVTNNEGISGNQVVDPVSHNLFIAHTDSSSAQARVSEGRVAPHVPTGVQATWTESPVLDKALCPDPTCITTGGSPEAIAGENFASIARDSAGYLYVAFTFAPYDNSGASPVQSKPEAIYVVHSLQPATMADPSTLTWSAPVNVSGNQTTPGTDVFPWITAGSNGRVDVAWYHTDTSNQGGVFGAANLTSAEWTVQLGQSLNAHSGAPAYTVSAVTEHPVKHGQICTAGLGCVSGGDRSLGDYLQVTTDAVGAALVTYVDDTSADTAAGEDAGPTEVSRQISGASLLASVGTVPGVGSGPGVPYDSVVDPTGDAFFSAGGTRTPAGDNLDLVGSTLTDEPGGLVGTIKVKSLASLTSAVAGNADASWMLRWTYVTPGQVGNGHIYYAGMDNNLTGTPTFFDGDTSCIPGPANPAEHCKYLTYPQTNTLGGGHGSGSYDAATGVITFHIPAGDVGSPPAGSVLYSVTAFTAVSTTPQSATTLFNLTDATTPYDHVIAGTPPGNAPEAPLAAGLVLAGAAVLLVALVRRRRSRGAATAPSL